MKTKLLSTAIPCTLVATLGLVSTQSLAADCEAPDMPTMPDGASAKMEDMLAGQKSVKSFQASNMAYMQCLEDEFNGLKKTVKEGDDATTRANAEVAYRRSVEAYNAAVSAEEEVAGAFNVELRAYKAANAK